LVLCRAIFSGAVDGKSATGGQLFEEVEPIEAKNVGRIEGWRTTHRALAATPGAR